MVPFLLGAGAGGAKRHFADLRVGGLVPLGPTGRTPAILQCVGRAEGKKYTTSIQLFRNAAPPAQPELFVCYHCDMQSQAAIQQQTRTTYN